MKAVGLTGGVGMGKSATANLLRERGVPVVDTDELARQLVAPGQPALEEIKRAFGEDVVGPDGQLRRADLARRVFADPVARRQLEQILHPRIEALWRAQVNAWREQGTTRQTDGLAGLPGKPPQACYGSKLMVVAIPLLFETGAERHLDATICVACSAATQRARLVARGWSPEHIQQRIHAQWPIEEKMRRADYVIWAEGGLAVHAAQLDRILTELLGAG